MPWKWALTILLTIISLAGGVATYHKLVNYIEPKAHAADVKEELENNIAMVQEGFQDHLVWEAIRQVKREMREIQDRTGKSDPILMKEAERERYRELEDELEYLQLKQRGEIPADNGG